MKVSGSGFYSTKREVLGEVCPLDTPFRLGISVSEVCNFKCVYCFRSVSDTLKNGYTTKPFMDMEMFEKVVQDAKKFSSPIKKIFLNVTGEPLCHKELPRMIKYLKREMPEPVVAIQTNGSLLNSTLSKQLVESGLDHMLISLQGITPEKYRDICGATVDFERFRDNIRYLYSIRNTLKVFVKVPDIALSEHEVAKYYDMFSPISDEATIEKINPVFNEVDYSKLGVASDSTANRIGTDYGKQKVCSYPFYELTITTNGNAYPCVQSIIPCTFGNINTESLVDIWNGRTRADFLKKRLREESIPRCDICTSKSTCILSPEDSIGPYAEQVLSRMIAKEKSL